MRFSYVSYDVGDTITYTTFGGHQSRTVRVTHKEDDIKNGRPGFDGVVILGPETDLEVWGYDDQITKVS